MRWLGPNPTVVVSHAVSRRDSMRTFVILGSAVLALTLVVGFAVLAPEPGTSAEGTPGTAYCATPVAEAESSPEIVVAAPTTAADPGGSDPGTPVGLFPCGTPDAGGPTTTT
jgi:hypothetical protein